MSAFTQTWTAEILKAAPMIAPTRQFVYPQRIAGEEDAMERGALQLMVKPRAGGSFLATCALGFRSATLPNGVWTCPAQDDMLAVAGGYAYLVNTLTPETCVHLPLRPVAAVLLAEDEGLLLLAGFHTVAAVGTSGLLWQSAKVSWEGVTLTGVRDGKLHGLGWDMHTDREEPFVMDLATGQHEGGGFHPPNSSR